MSSKLITRTEFHRLYLRTGKDPDGNDLSELILGGPEDSYNQYLLHQHTAYPIQFNSLIPISLLQPHISLEPSYSKPNQPKPQTEKLYIWRSKDDDKVRPAHADRDDKIFHWNSSDIKPGEDYGCRCYAEFLDQNGKPNGEYGRIAWPAAGTESNPQPYYEPSDKNGKPLHEKHWKTLTPREKELRRQEELAKFKNSDRLKENIKIAKKKYGHAIWFKEQVQSGGPWDYKKNGHPEMEHVGNFNFGATGKALGIPGQMLKRGAGWQQVHGGAYDPKNGHYLWIAPYGDDPIDQHYIQEGIDWYYQHYRPKINWNDQYHQPKIGIHHA